MFRCTTILNFDRLIALHLRFSIYRRDELSYCQLSSGTHRCSLSLAVDGLNFAPSFMKTYT